MDIKAIAKINRRKALAKDRFFVLALIFYPMLLFAVFTVGTNINSILLAFQKIDKFNNYSFAGLQNFKTVLKGFATQGSNFFNGVVNSLIMIAATMFVSLPVALFFSYYLYKKAPFSTTFRIIVMVPSIMSALISGLMMKNFIYSIPDLGKMLGINNIPNLLEDPYALPTIIVVMIWEGFGSGLILLANAMGTIDASVIESGEIDGITLPKEVWYIVLPLIWPTVSTFIILAVSGIFSVMGPLYLFFDLDAPLGTYTIGYLVYKFTLSGGKVLYPQVAALGIISTCVVFPLTLLIRLIVEKVDPTK